MLTEIDKDFYCSKKSGDCFPHSVDTGDCTNCINKYRKYPTPEQFKEEYGVEWTGAVYAICINFDNEECEADCKRGWELWVNKEYAIANAYCEDAVVLIVCAATPFGKPPQNWRPE